MNALVNVPKEPISEMMRKLSLFPNDWREGRRLRAWQLYEQGWKQKDIAVALGVTEGAVSQWMSQAFTCFRLKNLCFRDLAELENALLLARARLRHRKQTLRHCFAHAGYSL
jgi:Homeodomain-like domain